MIKLISILVSLLVLSGPMVAYAQNQTPAGSAATSSQQNTTKEDDEDEEETVDVSAPLQKSKFSFHLKNNRDPMLSPDDLLLIKYREQQRLAAEAAARKRKLEEDKRRQSEEEKRRQWELALMRDPTVLVRDKIRISGIIDKEVLIGGKLYTIGNVYKGAKIVAVGSDSVTFSYKGHKFVKRLKI